MQPSKLRRALGLIVLSACGGLDPKGLGPPRANEAEAGIAGFSFDAGTLTSGGKDSGGAKKPSEAWEPVGDGGSDDESEGPAGTANGGFHDSENEGGAGGETTSVGGLGGGSVEPGSGGALGGALGGAQATGGGGTSGERGLGGRGGHSAGGGRASTGSGGRGASGGVDSSAGDAGAMSGAGSGGGAGTSSAPPAPSLGELLFSEYVEGSGSYKALELRATRAVSLSGCVLATYSNGASSTKLKLNLTGELEAGAVTVLCSPSLATLLGSVCGRSTSLGFNGNDAVALECGGVTLDAIGVAGSDPEGGSWNGGEASTLNQTLRRRCGAGPDADPSDPFDPSLEWLALPTDTFDGLGDPTCG